MPRSPRHEAAGAIHHVVTQGNGRRPIVLDGRDRAAYLDRFLTEAARREWVVHASCLLDTHHHVVLTTPSPDLGVGVGRVTGGHAAWFNARHARSGAVFSERFWSRRADAHLVRACVYTLVNPVAARLVEHPGDWPWSTYAAIRALGCSELVASIVGGPEKFLACVDTAASRIRAHLGRDPRAEWAAIGELVTQYEGRG